MSHWNEYAKLLCITLRGTMVCSWSNKTLSVLLLANSQPASNWSTQSMRVKGSNVGVFPTLHSFL